MQMKETPLLCLCVSTIGVHKRSNLTLENIFAQQSQIGSFIGMSEFQC